ncbi:hypothetical protein [Trichormus sp. NMC-1]|uniref:hypothetical protein n=1 Tax=Trichormus sp. NMC-1 TaxID=1853259 RepID=UPI0008DC04A9|nr:hypothetical protein [Trichormus sp. NMC-1]
MGSIIINLGDVFLIDTPPKDKHFYVVIAKTSGDKYLFVNLTDKKNITDHSCVLVPNPSLPNFIVKESVIAYNFAREWNATELSQWITSGSPIPKSSFSPDVLLQIQQGGLISRRLAKKYKTILQKLLGIL